MEMSITDMHTVLVHLLAVAQGREEGQRSLAKTALRLATEEAQGRMKIAHDKGVTPGITNLFTGVRVPLDWSRRPHGAYEMLLFLATVTCAGILAGECTLSQTPVVTETKTLRDLMHFIAHDPGISIKPPFQYAQREMCRAFEEWETTEGAKV